MAQRLAIKVWENIFRNTRENNEDVEAVWLDSGDEWCLACDCEMFEDGFQSEKEALKRLEDVEKAVDNNLVENQKCIHEMWLVYQEQGLPVLYHRDDKVRAERYGEPKKVYVVVDDDYFVGTWQFPDRMHGFVGMYDTLDEAWEKLEDYRRFL